MEIAEVPQVQALDRSVQPDSKAMSLTGDTMKDLNNIAKEMGVSLDAKGNIAEVQPTPAPVTQPQVAPDQPQAVVTEPEKPVEVPAKFQNPDGTVNVEKLEKSSASVDEMIARYRAKEREAQQLQNRVNNPPPVAQVVQPIQQPVQAQLSPLEYQMAQDLVAKAAAQGLQLDHRLAIAQAQVMAQGLEAKHAAEMSLTQDLRQRVEDNERSRELQGLIDSDPALLSPGMVDTLWKVRQENPWLEKAPEPWKAAYIHLKGTQGHAPQVKTPNPTGTTAKAPPTPVGPVTRVQKTVDITDKRQLQGLTIEQLEAEAKKLFPGFNGSRSRY